ncbi:MAG: NAD-dependent epimerase/dehydratase family protein [Saprospiraceae bacterium]|nr:NAD-dependent epimerase/dehydratase family protein [Saprospiraceae bacterium]
MSLRLRQEVIKTLLLEHYIKGMENNSHILVTGATGFIGSYLVRQLLKEGHQSITCLKREGSDTGTIEDIYDQVKWETVDLLESDNLFDIIKDHEYVFHCAAMVSFDPAMRDEMFRANVEGTGNVVNGCIEASVTRLIYVSSVAALGRDPKIKVINEEVEWSESNLNNDYGKSKMLAEMEVWRASAEGLDVVIANPSLVLGVGDWNRSSLQIFTRIYKGIKFYPSGGNGVVDVRDVVDGLVRMGHTDSINQRFILTGANISYGDFFSMIAKGLGVSPPSRPLPEWLGKMAPLLEKIRSLILFRPPIITRSSLRTLNHISKYDNSKSINTLGMKYRSIEDTVSDCAIAYLSGSQDPLSS